MSLYLYCLSDDVTADAVEGATGISGASVRLVEAGGIRAVVSDFAGARVEVTRQNVLSHESVNRRVLARTTPLPFRFGALVGHAQLEDYIGSNRARLLASLDRVRGSVEMSVKILWDAAAQKGAAREQACEAGGPAAEKLGPGAAFLQAKRREIAGDDILKKRADEVAAWLALRVGDAARESVVRVEPGEALVVAAAHLVDRARLADYRGRARGASAERPALRFLVSGEWPPYSFCEIR